MAQAVATANGMLINAVSFVGNVSNTGGIFVTAAAQATSIGSTCSVVRASDDNASPTIAEVTAVSASPRYSSTTACKTP